jgi:hypothetical protein
MGHVYSVLLVSAERQTGWLTRNDSGKVVVGQQADRINFPSEDEARAALLLLGEPPRQSAIIPFRTDLDLPQVGEL